MSDGISAREHTSVLMQFVSRDTNLAGKIWGFKEINDSELFAGVPT